MACDAFEITSYDGLEVIVTLESAVLHTDLLWLTLCCHNNESRDFTLIDTYAPLIVTNLDVGSTLCFRDSTSLAW